ncbi:MAG TPA: hypothetical protein VJJ21_01205 [Candidatus Nanoarchaeia archaeon]|nr:hypothetical protein [Candidatus Nanoarchaeia archaeon]
MNPAKLVIEMVKTFGDKGVTYLELQSVYPLESEALLYNVLYALMEPYNFKDGTFEPLIKIEENWKPGMRGIECGRYFYREVGDEFLDEKLDRVRVFWKIKDVSI